ncbi:hypothetical protein P3X46_022213 [Hevea brasiliensis]|uniref:Ubiquitin-like protease family profile domain-containing protein n=1 Tax=Hevea brasiliensis TaxID=3981 RepID=A0ABQ9L858_HEVBR|nr:hypothetical protein P3X46_022213 [Hevea brasiliensis]
MNLYEAMKRFMGISPPLSSTIGSQSGFSLAAAATLACFLKSNPPQQTNGYNCGLYVME